MACLQETQNEKSTYPSFKDLDIIFFIEGKRHSHVGHHHRHHHNYRKYGYNQVQTETSSTTSSNSSSSHPMPLVGRDWDFIRDTVLRCLGKLANIHNAAPEQLKVLSDTYVEKLVRVKNDHDCWSLISFANNSGKYFNNLLLFFTTKTKQTNSCLFFGRRTLPTLPSANNSIVFI